MPISKTELLALGVVLALAAIVALPAVDDFFTTPDDYKWLSLTYRETREGPAGLLSMTGGAGGFFRPLEKAYFYVCYGLWGTNTVGYRIVCLTLHLAGCFTIFLMMRSIGFDVFETAVACALYTTSKATGECLYQICLVNELASSLASSAALLSFVKWLETGKWKWTYIAVLAVAFGLLFKEDVFAIIPVVIATGVFLSLGHWRQDGRLRLRRTGITAFLLVVLAAAYLPCQFAISDASGRIHHGIYEAKLSGVWQEVLNFGAFTEELICGDLSCSPTAVISLCLLAACFLARSSRREPVIICVIWSGWTILFHSIVTGGTQVIANPRYGRLAVVGLAGIFAFLWRAWLGKRKLSTLESLVAGAVFYLLAGRMPLRPVMRFILPNIWLYASIAVLSWGAIRLLLGRDYWIGLVPAIFAGKALTYVYFLPWVTGCTAALLLTVLGARAWQRRWPCRREIGMAAIVCVVAFGLHDWYWLGLLVCAGLLDVLAHGCGLAKNARVQMATPAIAAAAAAILILGAQTLRQARRLDEQSDRLEATFVAARRQLSGADGTVYWQYGAVSRHFYAPQQFLELCTGYRLEVQEIKDGILPRDHWVVTFAYGDALRVRPPVDDVQDATDRPDQRFENRRGL